MYPGLTNGDILDTPKERKKVTSIEKKYFGPRKKDEAT